jgi:hypothetical protein
MHACILLIVSINPSSISSYSQLVSCRGSEARNPGGSETKWDACAVGGSARVTLYVADGSSTTQTRCGRLRLDDTDEIRPIAARQHRRDGANGGSTAQTRCGRPATTGEVERLRCNAWPLMPLVGLVLVRSTKLGRLEHAVSVKNMYVRT